MASHALRMRGNKLVYKMIYIIQAITYLHRVNAAVVCLLLAFADIM